MPSFNWSDEQEKQVQEGKTYPLLPDGEYDFQCIKAELKTSSKGNQMIAVEHLLWDEKGKQHRTWDRFTFTEKAMYRLRNYCKATGLDKQWKARCVEADDVVDCVGRLQLKTTPERYDSQSGKTYKAKNEVDYYIEGKGKEIKGAPVEDDFEDTIPF